MFNYSNSPHALASLALALAVTACGGSEFDPHLQLNSTTANLVSKPVLWTPKKVTYLIITPKYLNSAITALVNQKQAKGYAVITKAVEDFGYAYSTKLLASQIRDYVLDISPNFVLLVGDHDKVPGYHLSFWDAGAQKTIYYTSDMYLGMHSGDIVPSIAVGRLSSNDWSTVAQISKRLVQYPQDTTSTWRRRVIMTGWIPRERPEDNPEDAGWRGIEEIGAALDVDYQFEYNPVDYTDATEQQWQVWSAEDSTEASLVDSVVQGAAIVRYLGHGGSFFWENIGVKEGSTDEWFHSDEVRNLDLGGKTPLVISAACETAKIKGSNSFAEAWQTSLNAVGFFGADVKSSTWWNDRITQRIFHQIVSEGKRGVGEILIDAMKDLYYDYPNKFSSFVKHTVKMYRYLGDPDTLLAIP
jgi:hypothetical protein